MFSLSHLQASNDIANQPSRIPTAKLSTKLTSLWRGVAHISSVTVAIVVFGSVAFNTTPTMCSVQPISITMGTAQEIALETPTGRPCTVALHIGPVIVKNIKIEVEPNHGRVSLRGRTGVVYIPDPRFKGEDRFTFALHGQLEGVSGSSFVHVHAIVR
jgi:hypothetical protein